ncbi:MAG: adenosylcobinamide-GDP ribazoletransferase [Opitutales bacterium]|nr:adenosylcobinamide-GDP ribazoletransferase [Opitutales bacterium]
MKNKLGTERRLFLTAVMFYTRIPCPYWVGHDLADLNKATRYFPLIGWLVGGFSFAVFWLSVLFLPLPLAVVLSLAAGVWITGAFHEDGFADSVDGFGGGWTKEKILEIMKDSRIGAFGVIALVLLFLLKYEALSGLLVLVQREGPGIVFLIFVAYHSLSRLGATNLVFTSVYSREDAQSKAKPIAQSWGRAEVVGAYLTGVFPLAVLALFFPVMLGVLLPLGILVWAVRRYCIAKLGGYTGDVLGALQQLGEVACLLAFLALWS